MTIRDVYEQSFEEKKQAMIQQREEWTKKLIDDNLKFYPQASRDVLEFIANLVATSRSPFSISFLRRVSSFF